MAEYIDRNGLIRFLDNIQQPKMSATKGFKYITIDDAIRVISERPTADVILIPEGATNGEVVEEIFDKSIYYTLIRMMYSSCCEKLKKWWNAPYKKGGEINE
jgi:hypothetical protein